MSTFSAVNVFAGGASPEPAAPPIIDVGPPADPKKRLKEALDAGLPLAFCPLPVGEEDIP